MIGDTQTLLRKLMTMSARPVARILIVVSAVVAVTRMSAQGTVNFANSATSLIKYDPAVYGGVNVSPGQLMVGLLYWATDPGAVNLDGSLAGQTMIATTANFVSSGRFLGGIATTPNTIAPGANAWFAVVAWQNTYSSYDNARNDGAAYGYSAVFENPTGNPTTSPPGPAAALSAFTGITMHVTAVPEPPAVLLGLMGAAGFLVVCRRK
jgi:hypothetical protein